MQRRLGVSGAGTLSVSVGACVNVDLGVYVTLGVSECECWYHVRGVIPVGRVT